MKKMTFALLPVALALSLAMASAAIAGPPAYGGDGGSPKNGGGDGGSPKNGGGGGSQKNGGGGGHGSNFGTGNGMIRSFKCVLNGYTVYVPLRGECAKLKRAVAGGSYHSSGHSYVSAKISVRGGGHVHSHNCAHYQSQRVIRYYSPASPAARQQAEKRARKAARVHAEAYVTTGYGGSVIVGGGAYDGGYAYESQQVIVRKHKKHKRKHSRVIIQQPAYVYDGSYGYDYEQPVLSKSGGY